MSIERLRNCFALIADIVFELQFSAFRVESVKRKEDETYLTIIFLQLSPSVCPSVLPSFCVCLWFLPKRAFQYAWKMEEWERVRWKANTTVQCTLVPLIEVKWLKNKERKREKEIRKERKHKKRETKKLIELFFFVAQIVPVSELSRN